MTFRQFRAWTIWLRMELDRPSRADWYSMQTAAEVRRGWVKDAQNVDTNDLLIHFKDGSKPSETRWTEDEKRMAERVSKGRVMAALKGAEARPKGS